MATAEINKAAVPGWGEELVAEARAVRGLLSDPAVLARFLVNLLEKRDDEPALALARRLHETLRQEGQS